MKTIKEIIDERALDRSTVLKAAQRGAFGEAARKSGATWLIDDTSAAFEQWLASRKRKQKQMGTNEQQPPQELVDWLDELREGVSQGEVTVSGDAPKAYMITGTRPDGTHKQWRAMDAYQAGQNAETLWNQGRWASIAINGVVRYSLEEGEATHDRE
jgi:hypothetical protein